jgi:hypothetical protein
MHSLKGVKTPVSVFLPQMNQGDSNITALSFDILAARK